MTLIQLEYIVAVDKHRHFVTAADECNVTQPTLSMQIKKLEEELGIILFDRSKQPIEPTSVGRQIIDQARVILKNAGQIGEIIVENQNEVGGKVTIGIIPTIANYLVPLFIPALMAKYPKLELNIEEWMTHEAVEQLRLGNIDMAIIATPLSEPDFSELPLYYEPFLLYSSANHPLQKLEKISSRDLQLDEMWLLSDGHCFRNHVMNICGQPGGANSKLNFRYKTGSLNVLMRLVDKYQGYTLLPYLASLEMTDEQRKTLREFKEPTPKREISLIYSPCFQRNKLIQAIQDEIRNNIPANIRHLDNGKVVAWKTKVK